jgi:hypothetical protein
MMVRYCRAEHSSMRERAYQIVKHAATQELSMLPMNTWMQEQQQQQSWLTCAQHAPADDTCIVFISKPMDTTAGLYGLYSSCDMSAQRTAATACPHLQVHDECLHHISCIQLVPLAAVCVLAVLRYAALYRKPDNNCYCCTQAQQKEDYAIPCLCTHARAAPAGEWLSLAPTWHARAAKLASVVQSAQLVFIG